MHGDIRIFKYQSHIYVTIALMFIFLYKLKTSSLSSIPRNSTKYVKYGKRLEKLTIIFYPLPVKQYFQQISFMGLIKTCIRTN